MKGIGGGGVRRLRGKRVLNFLVASANACDDGGSEGRTDVIQTETEI